MLTPVGLGLAVVAAVAIFAGVALLTGFLSPPGPAGPSAPPATAHILVRSTSASITFDRSQGWLADDDKGTVRRFDETTGRIIGEPIRTGGRPIAVTAAYGRIWVADISNSVVYVIDPKTARVARTQIAVGQGPVSLATGEGGVWVASLLAGTVSLIDPRTLQVTASVALPDGAVRLVVGGGYVWVTGQTDTLTRIDPRPLGVSLRWRELRVGQGPIGVAYGGGAVWVANAQSGTVTEVDPRRATVTKTVFVSSRNSSGATSDPTTVSFSRGRIWVGVGQQSTLYAFDPQTGARVGSALSLPGVVRELALDPLGGLWASTANPGRVLQISPG